jgi:hypothetical protein
MAMYLEISGYLDWDDLGVRLVVRKGLKLEESQKGALC